MYLLLIVRSWPPYQVMTERLGWQNMTNHFTRCTCAWGSYLLHIFFQCVCWTGLKFGILRDKYYPMLMRKEWLSVHLLSVQSLRSYEKLVVTWRCSTNINKLLIIISKQHFNHFPVFSNGNYLSVIVTSTLHWSLQSLSVTSGLHLSLQCLPVTSGHHWSLQSLPVTSGLPYSLYRSQVVLIGPYSLMVSTGPYSLYWPRLVFTGPYSLHRDQWRPLVTSRDCREQWRLLRLMETVGTSGDH